MDITDPRIVSLTGRVDAACEEVEMTIQFHEAWRPTAFDEALMGRMSHCYAGNTFVVVRAGLRREVILALMRLWDHNSRALNLRFVAEELADPDVIAAFAADRASRIPIPGVEDSMRRDLQELADSCLVLIRKYMKGGSHADVLARLRDLRNQKLAHRQMKTIAVTRPEPDRDEVEELYIDMLELVSLLFHLVKATAYNLTETAEINRHHARFFWEAVRGEWTEGHPRYRPPI